MPELRRHYFLDEYCIIAAERKKRPSDFGRTKAEAEDKAEDETRCPFCQGNEEMTPPSLAVYTDQEVQADGTQRIHNWRIRVFPNRFAAMVPSPEPPTSEWIALPGHGRHQIPYLQAIPIAQRLKAFGICTFGIEELGVHTVVAYPDLFFRNAQDA